MPLDKISKETKEKVQKRISILQDANCFERWDTILSYSLSFDRICSLSDSVRRTLCRPSQYFYFKDALLDVFIKTLEGTVSVSKNDLDTLCKLSKDLISGEYTRYINYTGIEL